MKYLHFVVALAFLVLMFPNFASAETAQAFVIDFKPLADTLMYGLTVIVGTVVTVIAFQIKQRWGVEIDKKTVETAMQSGLQYAQAKLATSDILSVPVQSEILANAGNYAIAHVPSALKSVGVDVTTEEGRDILKERLTARLAPAIMAGAASSSPMTVAQAASLVNPNVDSTPVLTATAIEGVAGSFEPTLTAKDAVLAAAAIPGIQVHVDPVNAPLPLLNIAEDPKVKDVVTMIGGERNDK